MILSVLICSVPNRLKNFSTIEKISELAENLPVEILYLGDNKKMSVGEKRNHLISLAKGKYITFVDDDDRIENNYITEILNAIQKSNADCITYIASVSINNKTPKNCYYSKNYKNENKENAYYRMPNHLMIWKKSIINNFKNISYGEDTDFAQEMLKKNYTEYNINKILYNYDFNSTTTETQKKK